MVDFTGLKRRVRCVFCMEEKLMNPSPASPAGDPFGLMMEVSSMMTQMGFDGPTSGEPVDKYAPKLHAFVKAMYEKRDE